MGSPQVNEVRRRWTFFSTQVRPSEEEETLKTYFAKKKQLSRKYEDITNLLKVEEAAAIELAAKKHPTDPSLRLIFEEIKADYQSTTNLILQQRLLEEEELLLHYKTSFKSASFLIPARQQAH